MTRFSWLDQPVSDAASCGLTQVPRSNFSRLSPGSQAGAFFRAHRKKMPPRVVPEAAELRMQKDGSPYAAHSFMVLIALFASASVLYVPVILYRVVSVGADVIIMHFFLVLSRADLDGSSYAIAIGRRRLLLSSSRPSWVRESLVSVNRIS